MPHRLLSHHAHRLLLLAVLISVLAACSTSAGPPKEEDDDWVNLCAGDPAVVITVPDQNLRESITIAVRRDTGGSEILSCANLAQVKQLNITNKDLSSLEGVQYLVNATVLSFDNSPFPNSHASRLGGLTSVARLTLRNLPLDRLSFAAGMTALESVSIDSTAITSIEPLRGLPNLRSLAFDDGKLTNLDPIGDMPALTFFRSLGNPVTALGHLVDSRSLEVLQIENSELTSIAGITAITSLRVLRINNAKLKSVPSLASMTSLKEIYFARNQLTSVPILPPVDLDILVLSYNHITHLTGIDQAGKISELLLSDNRLTDLLPLANLPDGITELDLANNLIWELGPIVQNPNMFSSGAWLYLKLNCLGITGAVSILYPDNNDEIASLQGRGVNLNYTPFQDYDLCTTVLSP